MSHERPQVYPHNCLWKGERGRATEFLGTPGRIGGFVTSKQQEGGAVAPPAFVLHPLKLSAEESRTVFREWWAGFDCDRRAALPSYEEVIRDWTPRPFR